MIKVILNTFFIDITILLSVLVVYFLCSAGINALKNGKKKYITDENIFSYTARKFFVFLRMYIPVLIKWFIVLFVIHCFCNLYDSFINFVQENVTYDNVPFLALLLDLLKSLFSFIWPFIIPVIVVLFLIVVLYGFFSTIELYSARNTFNTSIFDVTGVDNSKSLSLYHTNGSLAEDYDDTDNQSDESNALEEYGPLSPSTNRYESGCKKRHKRIFPQGWFFHFCNNSFACFAKIAKFLPKIFLVVAICIGANVLFLNVKNVCNIVNNQKRINELNMTIKNLSRAEAVVEISLVNEVRTPNAPYPVKTYSISVLDEDGEPIKDQTQEFTLEGNQLAIDTMNINFDYSEIAKGEHYNIAYPYRIHSDVVSSENGIPFEYFSEDGTSYPVMYGLENSVVYSMDRNTYYKNLTELFEIAKDETRAAEFGIRSFVGQDIHEPVYKGETYRLLVTGTGGVKLSKVEHLDVDDSEEFYFNKEVYQMYNNKEEEAENKGFFSKIGEIFN